MYEDEVETTDEKYIVLFLKNEIDAVLQERRQPHPSSYHQHRRPRMRI